ncbi:MAG: M3 family oligoendopeptidase [Planctomycetota bacterium]
MTTATDFVPADIDAGSWANVKPLFDDLLARAIGSAAEYEAWLADRSELEAACSEARADRYIAMSCDTEDKGKSDAYTAFVESVAPELSRAAFQLDKRQAELAQQFPLDADRYAVLDRTTSAAVDLFRDENVPLQTELDNLATEYQAIIGSMMVEFRGEQRTLPQMATFLEDTDRAVREEAWRIVASRRLQDKAKIDEVFDKQISIRDTVARNAGEANFVGFAFREFNRFDYTPADCKAFHAAVEKHVVPFNRSLEERRRSELGIDALRPWDLSVDPKGRAPLRPFTSGTDLISKSHHAFTQLDPRLAEMLAELGDGSNTNGSADGAMLDLDSRQGKAPGGYQYMRDRRREPFIFMNAAGLHRDVETMVHEAGHAFHSMVCRDEPLLAYRHSPIEFAEVASMTMELLTMPYWGGEGGFYPNEADANRARRKQLEGSVSLLAWIATIDAFQHWIYENPKHTQEQRTAAWLDLDSRFGASVDWSSLDDERAWLWQRQSHLFSHAFYYIEYGIAQLGALQLWMVSLDEGEEAAIDRYLRALKLGGSKPLPDLFAAAGLPFDFGEATIGRVAERVTAELAKLPE